MVSASFSSFFSFGAGRRVSLITIPTDFFCRFGGLHPSNSSLRDAPQAEVLDPHGEDRGNASRLERTSKSKSA